MAENLLESEHIRVVFGSTVAVRDVGLSLGPGQLLGLVGPNGAGKTTTLRALAGLQSMATGSVRILGHDLLTDAPRAMQYVGFAADTPPLYEKLTVEEFLQFVGLAYDLGPSDIDERIGFWLDQLWLTERRSHRIKTLSHGMRRRVAVARTLLPNPPVILLDEPASGLDPAGRVAFRRMLVSLREQGKAIIVSSHILADLHEFCTHIGIMSHGQMIRLGTVADVIRGEVDHRARYRLTLAVPIDDAASRLAMYDGVSDVRVDHDRIDLEYHEPRERAAELLRHMVRDGLPVAAFAPIEQDLEEAYLRIGVPQVD